MRKCILTFIVLVFAAGARAQMYLPGSFLDYSYRGNPANNIHFGDVASQKKWSLTKYSNISTSFSFFKGGNAMIIAAPMGLQLNRRLTNNLYAFAGVSIAPAYISLHSSFMNPGADKMNAGSRFNSNSLGLYSRAELGLMYVNDERTFSISGSVGIERSNSPMPVFAPLNVNQNKPALPVQR